MMTLRGHYDGGVVVLDEAPPRSWQAGTVVEVTPGGDPSTRRENVLADLAHLAAAHSIEGPPDLAYRHNDYAHGTKKP